MQTTDTYGECRCAASKPKPQSPLGRTTFVIAHRLSTIRRADQILVVENGEIVERGNHDALYTLGGRYRELCERQFIHLQA